VYDGAGDHPAIDRNGETDYPTDIFLSHFHNFQDLSHNSLSTNVYREMAVMRTLDLKQKAVSQ
jgi:hypothetical protein